MTTFKQFLDSDLNEAASVSVTVNALAPKDKKYSVTEIHPRKSPRGRTRWVDVSHHASEEEAKAAADAHAKKNNLHRMQSIANEEVESVQEELHRVNVSLSDPNHQMASQRKEKIQKIVKLKALDKEHALSKAKQYYKDRGYKVHDAEHVGVVNEEVELDEAVSVEHDRYVRSHGKNASGSGTWMFTHKRAGTPDYKNEKQVHQVNGSFADAKKSAKEWGKKHGHSTVYVMENVELDEANISTAPVKKVGFNDIVVRKHPSGHHVVVRKGGAYMHLKKGEKLTHKDMKDMASNRAKFHLEEASELEEKTLTPAELKKREEIAKAMEREKPGMDKSRKMAIATAVAKRVAEQYDDAE